MGAALGVWGSMFMESTSLKPWALNVTCLWVGALTSGVLSPTSDWVLGPPALVYVGPLWMSSEYRVNIGQGSGSHTRHKYSIFIV